MHLGIIIVLAAPVGIAILGWYLSFLYGEKLFGLDWPGHDLNNPDDPRLLKLNIEPPGDKKKPDTDLV